MDRLQRAEQRHWAPLYIEGLLRPAERKSVTHLAEQVAPGDSQQLHHFVCISPCDPAPLEALLVQTADRLVGGRNAVLIIDDTPLVKQGKHSVGVAREYCGDLGKRWMYYLRNPPPRTWRRTLARAIKARWSCEQAHQQMKNELGRDHYEGRGWRGIHRHALLNMLAFCFLRHLRLGGKRPAGRRRPGRPRSPRGPR